MADKTQRKVNKVLRGFNKGFAKDIAPYNAFKLKQFRRVVRNEYESWFLVQLYYNDTLVNAKWFDTLEITGVDNQLVGREFFWFVNHEVARGVKLLT